MIRKFLLKQIKLFALSDNKAIAILVTTSGMIKSRDFEHSPAIDDAYLQKIAGFINL